MVALSFSCYPIHLGGRVTHKVFSPAPFVAPAIFFNTDCLNKHETNT